jgi:hypothetical protein
VRPVAKEVVLMRSMVFTLVAGRARRLGLRCAAVAGVLALATGCGDPATTQSTTAERNAAPSAGTAVSPATIKPGQSIPPPAGKPVFTMTGKITAANKAGALVFDLPTVDRLGLRQVGLYEPWTKQNTAFRGIWLQDLLAVAGVAKDATRLHIVALDDYTVDLTMADIRAGGIMLATRAGDGSALPVDKGGPTRIVFLNGVKAGANADQWIWSIKAIDVQ